MHPDQDAIDLATDIRATIGRLNALITTAAKKDVAVTINLLDRTSMTDKAPVTYVTATICKIL